MLAVAATLLALACAPVQTAAIDLSPRYVAGQCLRSERTLTITVKQTPFEATRKGKTVRAPSAGSSDAKIVSLYRELHDDTILLALGSAARHVTRTYSVARASTGPAGDAASPTADGGQRSLFEGVSLDLLAGRAAAELIGPADRAKDLRDALRGQAPGSSLVALLPRAFVSPDANWVLDSATIVHGLGFDLDRTLFAMNADEVKRSAGPPSPSDCIFGELAWGGRATLSSSSKEHDGQPCAEIELDLTGKGEVVMKPAAAAAGSPTAGYLPFDAVRAEASVHLSGTFYFSTTTHLPVELHLTGSERVEYKGKVSGNPELDGATSAATGLIDLVVRTSFGPTK